MNIMTAATAPLYTALAVAAIVVVVIMTSSTTSSQLIPAEIL